jgi:hypothetical protein
MRVTLSVALYVLLGCVAGLVAADEKPERHVEKEGGFSYVPPKDWTIKEQKGLKYKLVAGPTAAGFEPAISFHEQDSPSSLKDYVTGHKAVLKKIRDYKPISEGEFKTADGTVGVRLVFQAFPRNSTELLRQSFYMFDLAKGKKLMVMGNAQAKGGDKLDATFDACLKSLKIEKPK